MQNAAATIAISVAASASSSSRSAPATRSFCSPHCQIESPAAAASVARPKIETTTRWRRSLNAPARRTTTIPVVSAITGEMPA
jgi:hypothetical protein